MKFGKCDACNKYKYLQSRNQCVSCNNLENKKFQVKTDHLDFMSIGEMEAFREVLENHELVSINKTANYEINKHKNKIVVFGVGTRSGFEYEKSYSLTSGSLKTCLNAVLYTVADHESEKSH